MANPNDFEEVQRLTPRAVFGIDGKVSYGLHIHPGKQHLIFPLGAKVGIHDLKTNKQEFLSGHTNNVSAVDVSRSGRYIASGQINHMGFPSYVILWDFDERKEVARHDLHKVRVQSICFSAADIYVISAGGRDDGALIVFDIETRTPLCRSVAARAIGGNALYVCPLNQHPSYFIVGGERHLRMWSIQGEQKKLHVQDIYVGKQQRSYISICIDKRDEFAYFGTMTGDIVKVCLNCCDPLNVTKVGYVANLLGAFGVHNPKKPWGKDCERYVNGVRNLLIVDDGLLLVGAGDGVIELVEERKDVCLSKFRDYPSPTWPLLKKLKRTKVTGMISAIKASSVMEYFICTHNNEIYQLNIKAFTLKLLKTCHEGTVYNIQFPRKISTVFATAGYETIRIWSTRRLQELLRIVVYNFACAALSFTADGSSLVSAWNDGIIRAFTPITGRLIYAIPNAHNKGCSALCISTNGRMLVTGGIEGQVRVWKIEPFRQSLVGVLKDHSGPISTLDFNYLDTELISACADGSCVIWDINRMSRKCVITSNTQFMTARYFPTGVQMLTCGTDGRINYWMVCNGSLLRELEGSKKSSVNCVAINSSGEYFISAGSDQLVKMWDYKLGVVVCQGSDHAAPVISAVFSPCGRYFVTGSKDGCVIIWDVPERYWPKTEVAPSKTPSNVDLEKAPSKVSSARSQTSVRKGPEHIDNLLASTPKGNVCCVECPPVSARKPQAQENCEIVANVGKC